MMRGILVLRAATGPYLHRSPIGNGGRIDAKSLARSM